MLLFNSTFPSNCTLLDVLGTRPKLEYTWIQIWNIEIWISYAVLVIYFIIISDLENAASLILCYLSYPLILNIIEFKFVTYIGKVFKAAICKRLLHSGASTSQILEMYVSMIRALRVLDPSDLLLNFIAAPVREYLIGRKDTVRCVVSSLTKNRDSELHG